MQNSGFISSPVSMAAALSYSHTEPITMVDYQDYHQLQPFIDHPLFHPNHLLYTPLNPNSNPLMHDFSNQLNDSFNDYNHSLSHDQFTINEPDFFDGLVQNANCVMGLEDYHLQQEGLFISPTLPDFSCGPPIYSHMSCQGLKMERGAAAARRRRRKITLKTEELGKLIPGGQKMKTAEMLQAAAYKYIKFLQAQPGILELVDSSHHQEYGKALESGEVMQVLLGSYLIQEKLYSSEKCLVPKTFVQKISEDRQMVN